MGRTTALRREIRKTFFPFMQGKGFFIDKRHYPGYFIFRRIEPKAVYVCDIQWAKYGRPRFIVNFGRCFDQVLVLPDAELAPDDIQPENSPEYGRLSPG